MSDEDRTRATTKDQARTDRRRSLAAQTPSTALVVVCLLLGACTRYDSLQLSPSGTLQTHYLLDCIYRIDPTTGFRESGHLTVFDPSPGRANLDVTIYFADRDPERTVLQTRPGATTSWDFSQLPVRDGDRFALKIESSEPVVAEATVAWYSSPAGFRKSAETTSSKRLREAATGYRASTALAQRWYVADGIILDEPDQVWMREWETVLILNPGDTPGDVTIRLFYSPFTRTKKLTVPARRLAVVPMKPLAIANHHYGVGMDATTPIAVQWRRTIGWYDSSEVMALWSKPALALQNPPGEGAALHRDQTENR